MKFRFWDFRLQSYTYFDLSSALPIYQDGKEGVVEQFTGLFDDSGKEIYVGDIIKHGCPTQQYESVVIYKAPSFIAANFFYQSQRGWRNNVSDWYVEWEKKGVEAYHQGYYRTNMVMGVDNYHQIIGNINENPEIV